MHPYIFSSWGGQVIDNRGKPESEFTPVAHMDVPAYFKEDEGIKGLMGWGGIILRSPDVDIIDLCDNYLKALHAQSKPCGKCNYCTTGFEELREVIGDMRIGEATEEDLEFIQSAAEAIVDSSKCSVGKRGPVAFLQALQYFADDFAQAVGGTREIRPGQYYSKVTAPCVDACPLHLDVPKYIEAIKEAKFGDALAVIRERLPLPGVLGRACFRPCESHCRRANVDEPIAIRHLKRFAADQELASGEKAAYEIVPSAKTGKVAVIGAGPAGVSCAYHLASRGHQVTIYESQEEPGGMAAMGIPDYRLPRDILKDEIDRIVAMGVTVQYNQTVGRDISLSQLESDFDAVFIAIGAQNSLRLGIEGEDQGYAGWIPGLQYLNDINAGRDPYPDGGKVLILGGGNVAIDCVRASFRTGKDDVHLVYRRTRDEMPADRAEIEDAEEEAVQFHFLTAPVRVVAEDGKVVGLECIRMELGEPDESGRPRPVPVEDSSFVMECDVIVPAIGQGIDLSFMEGTEELETTRWQSIVADPWTKQTRRPKLFVAGDCETGPDALVTACSGGRHAALNIDRLINEQPLEHEEGYFFDQFFTEFKVYDPEEEVKRVESKPRMQYGKLDPQSRKSVFDEVEEGFSAAQAVAEAERCLKCYQVATLAM